MTCDDLHRAWIDPAATEGSTHASAIEAVDRDLPPHVEAYTQELDALLELAAAAAGDVETPDRRPTEVKQQLRRTQARLEQLTAEFDAGDFKAAFHTVGCGRQSS